MYDEKVKTTIVIDKKIWEEFRLKVNEERGIRELSHAIEEALEDEASNLLVIKALKEMIGEARIEEIEIVKPLKPTNASEILREIRRS